MAACAKSVWASQQEAQRGGGAAAWALLSTLPHCPCPRRWDVPQDSEGESELFSPSGGDPTLAVNLKEHIEKCHLWEEDF